MDTLATSFQDPASGGAYSERPDHRTTGRQHLFPTAQLGISALMAGRLDVARGVAKWFRSLWDAQPELPGHAVRGLGGRRARARVAGGPGAGRTADFFLVTHFQEPRQASYNPGIAAAFLARYGAATGDAAALTLARDYLQLSAGAV